MKTDGYNFIVTKDLNTRLLLQKQNLLEIHNEGGVYIFVNEPKKVKELSFDADKVSLSNTLMF